MSHPPETSLTSRELVDALARLSPVNSGLKWLDDAKALIDAWVLMREATAHAAAIDAAASLVEEHALNIAQRNVAAKIWKMTPADAQRLYDLRIAEAVRDEAAWWYRRRTWPNEEDDARLSVSRVAVKQLEGAAHGQAEAPSAAASANSEPGGA